MDEMWTKEELKRGWILSNNESGDSVIQKLDDSDRFKSDDEATEFVVNSYNELLRVSKMLVNYLEELEDFAVEDAEQGNTNPYAEAKRAINKAKGE